MNKRIKAVWLNLLIMLVVMGLMAPLALQGQEHNCDFAAVMTRSGFFVSELPQAEALFYTFVKSRSAYSPVGLNDDGYGVVYVKNNESMIPVASQAWRTPWPYYNVYPITMYNPGPMDAAHNAIMTPANNAVTVMSHARNGSGGWAGGNHPFIIAVGNKSYAFMHNGSIQDSVKAALWNELYNHYGSTPGQWFVEHPSNWVPQNALDDYTAFIDTELLFHWIAKNIFESGSSTFSGLLKALTGNVRPIGDNQREISLYQAFNDNWASNVINFVLYDGEDMYVFRNSGINGNNYNLSYQVYGGFTGVKTRDALANVIPQFGLAHIQRTASPRVLTSFLDHRFAELSVKMDTTPVQGIPNQWLTYNVYISNNGPYAAANMVVEDILPVELLTPQYSLDGQRWSVWDGSENIGALPPYTSRIFYLKGRVRTINVPDFITNSVKVEEMVTSVMNADPNMENNKTSVTTRIVWLPLE